MNLFPMFLKMNDRHVVIVGGGEQAAQKCRLMLKTTAQIIILADQLDPELATHAKEGRIQTKPLTTPAEVFKDAALVFVATGCKGADAGWAQLAKDQGTVVNVVDYPDLCDAYTPSIVDRDPVVIAIGTEGTAPILGRQIKSQIEQSLEPQLGHFARLCGSLRDAVAHRIAPSDRRQFWRWVFNGSPRSTFSTGSERKAISMIREAIDHGQTPSNQPDMASEIYSLQADHNHPDLISVRSVKRLQEADLILYDDQRLCSVLEYARRDAQRRFTGTMQKSEIDDLAREAAKDAQNVVIMKAHVTGENVVHLATRVSATA